MLLVLAILLLIVFGSLGFALHVLWWGLILAVIVRWPACSPAATPDRRD